MKATHEIRLYAVQFIEKGYSYREVAKMTGFGRMTIYRWYHRYLEFGPESLHPDWKNRSESEEMNTLSGKMDTSLPGRETPMKNKRSAKSKKAKAKKTSLAERIEIVDYCLAHDLNYHDTAKHFGVTYHQVYRWVQEYQEKGEESLIDLRGKKKPESQWTREDQLARENELLKKRIEELETEKAFVKKLEELESRFGKA